MAQYNFNFSKQGKLSFTIKDKKITEDNSKLYVVKCEVSTRRAVPVSDFNHGPGTTDKNKLVSNSGYCYTPMMDNRLALQTLKLH